MTAAREPRHRAQFLDALAQFLEIHDRDMADDILRDAAILRFELTFEMAWKALQEGLRPEGLEVGSPRQTLSAALLTGWIVSETDWSEMLKDRNRLVHKYDFGAAQDIAAKLPRFAAQFQALAVKFREEDESP